MTMPNYARAFPALALALFSYLPSALADENPDRVGAPYFQVRSKDPNTDRLPLKETKAEVNIAGVIAHVKVTQVYQNEGSNPLEAIYVFPGSTRAAVFGMRMTIGERTIVAKIKKKEEARRLYERIRTIAPHHYYGWMGLAELARQEGDFATGFELARRGILCWDASAPGLLLFGDLALRVGRIAEAEWALTRGLALDPSSEPLRQRLRYLQDLRNPPE